MNAIERLEQLLDERDERIEKLERELEHAKQEIEFDASWCLHVEHEEGGEPNPDLPVPRLEIRWALESTETIATYSLVYRHLVGTVVTVPLGRTKTSGALNDVMSGGNIRIPFRDGAHIANEMRQLGLPGFAIAGSHVRQIFADALNERTRTLPATREGPSTRPTLKTWRSPSTTKSPRL